MTKPFLKWVGGKTQLMESVMDKFPETIENYHEIFLGGGSVLFTVLSKGIVKGKVYAYDINKALIHTYKNIQNYPDEVHAHLSAIVGIYDTLHPREINRKPRNINEGKTSKESYYYWIRSQYNEADKTLPKTSAMFIFLNKTGFRGMYREGPKGFNVPYGHYKTTPNMPTREFLCEISKLIKDVEFKCMSYEDSLANVKPEDFVYLDPPYAPETDTSFVAYTRSGFAKEEHLDLFGLIKNLQSKFLMSNSCATLVQENFEGYDHEFVGARRAINSKDPSATTTEILIWT